MNNINNFMAFLNWLGKDQQIKLNAYKFYASVSYETNVQQLSFYNKSLELYIYLQIANKLVKYSFLNWMKIFISQNLTLDIRFSFLMKIKKN